MTALLCMATARTGFHQLMKRGLGKLVCKDAASNRSPETAGCIPGDTLNHGLIQPPGRPRNTLLREGSGVRYNPCHSLESVPGLAVSGDEPLQQIPFSPGLRL